MTRDQLITAMHDAFCNAPADGAARWGAVADVVSTDPDVIARLDGERTDRLAAQAKTIAEAEEMLVAAQTHLGEKQNDLCMRDREIVRLKALVAGMRKRDYVEQMRRIAERLRSADPVAAGVSADEIARIADEYGADLVRAEASS